MCFSVKTPEAPEIKAPPKREDAANNAQQDARRRAADQQGVFGNIFTSLLGDSGFGSNTAPAASLASTQNRT